MRLLDQVGDVTGKKHYSIRTEQAYINWIRQYILFQGKRHPKDMGEKEISEYLSHLATSPFISSSCSSPRAFGLSKIPVYRGTSLPEAGKLQTPPHDEAPRVKLGIFDLPFLLASGELLTFGSTNTWHEDFHLVSSVLCPAHTMEITRLGKAQLYPSRVH